MAVSMGLCWLWIVWGPQSSVECNTHAPIRFTTRAYRPGYPPAADLISLTSFPSSSISPLVMSTYDHSRVSRFIGHHPPPPP